MTGRKESVTNESSIALYHYLCQNIVGTEEQVKTIRTMNSVRDHLKSFKHWAVITSGSFGEGLTLRGSDIDIMKVYKDVRVCEDTNIVFIANEMYLIMEMENTQPGFTYLRLRPLNDESMQFCGVVDLSCVEVGSDFYFSSYLCKKKFLTDTFSNVHGPCVTDDDGCGDIAYCLHSELWITPAKQWITRPNNSWPRYDVKLEIVKHGVLFVPVGMKGSSQEELEWRISFSVGEKFLIYSFTHTQLLCYALLKILLKDIIALDIDCKELLCSYFMKTILFWLSEELPSSEWKPENLISCYMRCFKRLIYCVEYRVCPHYFIPENNLFLNKIQGQAQKTLLNKLYILNSYGWQCILLSNRISNSYALTFDMSKEPSHLQVNNVKNILTSVMYVADALRHNVDFCLEKVIYKVLSSKSTQIKNLYTYYMSKYICENNRVPPFDDMSGNKSTYKQYKTYRSTLLLNTYHDAVSGWLMLASFFYGRKQYNTALYILRYSLYKCSPEKLLQITVFSDVPHELLNLQLFRKMSIVKFRGCMVLNLILFYRNSLLLPDELHIEPIFSIPPVVYAQFLRFLCHFHLRDSRQYLDSLNHLIETINTNYFIETRSTKIECYNILASSFQLLGDIQSAMHYLMVYVEENKAVKESRASEILSLISRM